MFNGDRASCVTFDEMSFRENLPFCQKLGCIEGIEDNGRQSRTSNFANYALIFMLLGLCKTWK
jgi:hypothetical protein